MSVRVMSWVWENSRATLGSRLVLLAIADHAGHDGTDAWPTVAELARVTGMSERQVLRATAQLEAAGELVIERRRGENGRQRVNRYTVPMGQPGDTLSVGPGDISDANRVTSCPEPGDILTPILEDEPSLNRPKNRPTDTGPTGPAVAVFEAWKEATGRNGTTRLTPKRQRYVRERLKEGYSVDELVSAVRGVARSPFHLGQNDRHQRYDDLTLILRDGEHVEKFRDLEQGDGPPDMLDAVIAEIFAEKSA